MPITFDPSKEDRAEEFRGTVVDGYGRTPNDVMIVGEAPGASEARRGRPFVGRSGEMLARYLGLADFNVRSCYITNVVKEFTPGNPDPTPAQIAQWSPILHKEILTVRPRVIIAAGRFAARWLLDDATVDMDTVRSIPHRSPHYDDLIVLPCLHPASGFYDADARPQLVLDYAKAAEVIRAVRAGRPVDFPEDAHLGAEQYEDLSGREFARRLRELPELNLGWLPIGLDTEGHPGSVWSIQVSTAPGSAWTLRTSRSDFAEGVAALQRYVNGDDHEQPWVAIHNLMHDLAICREIGLELFDSLLFDSQYAAYILRTEPQGLKALAYRWCGMRMASYLDTVGPVGLEKQLAYLGAILEHTWPKPEGRVEYSNDGTFRLYTPQPVERRAEAILVDYYSEKLDKDGNRCDPEARWKQVDRQLREMVEERLGPMPIGTLADIPLDRAIHYASRDPDATLRLFHKLSKELTRLKRWPLMMNGMAVGPIFEEMQAEGMPAKRAYFEALAERMWDKMTQLSSRISHRYYDGRPFNPASADQVRTIMRRRALKGEKLTKRKLVSTGKKSIEHLRHKDAAIADIIDWREHQKIKDSFCDPIIEWLSARKLDIGTVHTIIKWTRTATRRISTSGIPLVAVPVRHELGKQVRDGFECPEGELFGSWDLSQIEMRYMAHVSLDPLLIKFFNDPRLDVHCETAARIFGLKINERADTKEERYANIKEMDHRYPSKRAGFGIITNITGSGLYDQLRMFGCEGWDVPKCDALIAEWLKIYRGVDRYLGDCKNEAHAKGVVYDCWGMPRYLSGVYSSDRLVVAEEERAASSHKIQGGAQGMIQAAMAWLRPHVRALRDAGFFIRWVLQIHDELLLRFQEDLWEVIDPLVREGLTEHSLKLVVPVKCSGSKARTWGKLK